MAQTGQVLDVRHRSGNVHDSHGAQAFIRDSIATVRSALPGVCIEVRMESAFFSRSSRASMPRALSIRSASPAKRFVELKERIEARRWWHRIEAGCAYFEAQWKPKAWNVGHRFLFIRTRVKQQHEDPVQLDLFIPHAYGYEFKVILTNTPLRARKVLAFHNGRGSQEGIFAELKSDNQLDYVPTRTWVGNQIYLGRELQMIAHPPWRTTLEKRPAFWDFARLDTSSPYPACRPFDPAAGTAHAQVVC